MLPDFMPHIGWYESAPEDWLGVANYPRVEGTLVYLGGRPIGEFSPVQELDWREGFTELPWEEARWRISDHPNLPYLRTLKAKEEILKLYRKPFQLKLALRSHTKLSKNAEIAKSIQAATELYRVRTESYLRDQRLPLAG